ncbi:MAG: electron transfer flavoprotein subunit alpha/FixB family protein [Gammaproteobacteria bacterium]|nr:electron transfer flavoprotein subunit alpha/FixB family protein [Gammaproteobacteria bacterium]
MSENTAAPAKPKGKKRLELDPRLAAYKGIWVFVEMERGQVHQVSWELLGEGRKLADILDVELSAIILGGRSEELGSAARSAFTYGADVAYIVADSILTDYRNEPYTKALTDLVNKYQPEILLLGATTLGRDLAGSVATTLLTGLTADCTELAIDPDNRGLLATRPTFGGSLLCTIQTLNYRPQMATIRPRVMAMPAAVPERSGRVISENLQMQEDDIIAKVLEFIPDEAQEQAQLAYADIIVAGGRGMGKAENFRLIWDLAAVLGAEVGGSRPVTHAGWLPADRQVGQSGKTVRPKLYIAAGISGAIQHRVGMEASDVIIAINNDPNAPIFDFATYGVIGDAVQILPVLTDAFRSRLAVNRRAG